MSPTERAPLRAVLLDLDGTLVDSHPALIDAYRRFVSAHGGTPTDDEYQLWNGPPLADIVAGLAQAHAIAGDRAALLDEYIRLLEGSYLADARLAPGATALLDWLDRRGIARALVTSAPARLTLPMLAARGVAERFAVVVCGDNVLRGKPAPDAYREALRRLGTSAAGAISVEDTPAGVRAACDAGLRCIGVGPGGEALLRAGALAVAADLAETQAMIEGLESGPGRVIAASDVEVILREGGPPADAPLDREIAARWALALAERPSLTDGEIVTVRAIERGGGALRIVAGLARYRHFVAQRGGLRLGLRALGVTAITVLHGDHAPPRLVLGRRASSVTQYPGAWELVPSGSVARKRVATSGAVDVRGQVLEELFEELGLPAEQVLALSALGVIEDLADHVLDVAFHIEARGDEAVLLARATARGEYDAIALPPVHAALADRGALAAIAGAAGLVPTVNPLLELYARTAHSAG